MRDQEEIPGVGKVCGALGSHHLNLVLIKTFLKCVGKVPDNWYGGLCLGYRSRGWAEL